MPRDVCADGLSQAQETVSLSMAMPMADGAIRRCVALAHGGCHPSFLHPQSMCHAPRLADLSPCCPAHFHSRHAHSLDGTPLKQLNNYAVRAYRKMRRPQRRPQRQSLSYCLR